VSKRNPNGAGRNGAHDICETDERRLPLGAIEDGDEAVVTMALVGLGALITDEPKHIAAPHTTIATDAVREFLGAGEAAAAGASPLSAGEIAARDKDALVAVFCQK
jgi:hypothetical protein